MLYKAQTSLENLEKTVFFFDTQEKPGKLKKFWENISNSWKSQEILLRLIF